MTRRDNLLASLLLLGAILFNLAVLWPEASVEAPLFNDGVLHLNLSGRAVQALERGEDPTDPWVSTFADGYPLFHYYQHLPHVVTALLFKALGGRLPLRALFDGLRLLLLSTFPLSIYWSGRRLGFSALPAALTGVIASLLATNGLYGLDWSSYVWCGYGLYTQLWGMWLLGPATSSLYVTLRQGRAYAGSATLLATTLLSHTVLGYCALLSGGLIVLLGGKGEFWRRSRRLVLVLLLVLAACAYFLLPFTLDRVYMNRSVWEEAGKYNAYGWEWTLQALVRGELLDFGRFPSLTLLSGLGLIICLARGRRDERFRLLAAFFIFWLLLYFGRPTWGALLDLLPLGRDLHLHRLIALVHVGAIGLAGVGLAWLAAQALKGLQDRPAAWRLAVASLVLVGLMAPVYRERVDYAMTNARWMRESLAAWQADRGDLSALLIYLKGLPPGRVYAGRGANWGKDYTIGSAPAYALLSVQPFDNPGYLYHALSYNADIEGYLDEARPATFNLFNLRYVIVPEGQPAPPFAGLLARSGRHQLYQVETSGYFDLVDSDFELYGSLSEWFPAAQAWVLSGLVEARQHPRILFAPLPASDPSAMPLSAAPGQLAALSLPQRAPCGKMLEEKAAGNTYQAGFEANRACWLLFKATYHPGWRAVLDGQPVETHMLAPSFLGMAVEPGKHQVTLTYEAGGWRRAWLLGGLVILLLAALLEWRTPAALQAGQRLVNRSGIRPAPGFVEALSRFSGLRARLPAVDSAFLALLVFILLAGLATLQLKQMSGHDALEYLPRAVEFYRNLSDGNFLPRWAADLSAGYGQPFFIFNPPLIYYAAALFHALGFSLVAALNLACLALLAVAGIGMYCYGREFFGAQGGLVAGAAYVLAPFMLVNLYVRHALADFAAMAFLPWAFWGLYRLAKDAPQAQAGAHGLHLAVTCGAICLVMLSSNPLSLVAIPVFGLYAVFLGWRARSWRSLGRGLAALGHGLGLAAFFWLPALVERNWVKIYRLLSGYLNYRNHFVYLHQLIYSRWGYGLSLPGAEDGMSFGLGLVPLALLIVSLALAWRARHQPHTEEHNPSPDLKRAMEHFWFFVALLGLTVFLVTDNSLWVWQALPLLQYLEFPWRILALASLAMAFFCGFPFLFARDGRQRRWLAAAVLTGLLVTAFPNAHPESYLQTADADYSPQVIASQGIEVTTAGEYEPAWVSVRPETPAPAERLVLLDGQARFLNSHITSTRCEWLIQANEVTRFRLGIFYYPGWQLTIDGQPYPLAILNPDGTTDFFLSAGVHQVTADFDSTPLRNWAGLISLGALLLLGYRALRGLSGRQSRGLLNEKGAVSTFLDSP